MTSATLSMLQSTLVSMLVVAELQSVSLVSSPTQFTETTACTVPSVYSSSDMENVFVWTAMAPEEETHNVLVKCFISLCHYSDEDTRTVHNNMPRSISINCHLSK